MSATDEQHKVLSTLYVRRFRSKKNYLSLAVDISGKTEKNDRKNAEKLMTRTNNFLKK